MCIVLLHKVLGKPKESGSTYKTNNVTTASAPRDTENNDCKFNAEEPKITAFKAAKFQREIFHTDFSKLNSSQKPENNSHLDILRFLFRSYKSRLDAELLTFGGIQ